MQRKPLVGPSAHQPASKNDGSFPNLRFTDLAPVSTDAGTALFDGLNRFPKRIEPKFLYDAQGSKLFEQITALPEYYPTRTEVGILHGYRQQIADCVGPQALLFEPGSGACEKVRHLLSELKPAVYVPLDISPDFLLQAVRQLASDYPWLAIHGVCADFCDQFTLPEGLPAAKKVAFYPGSTIGNFHPHEARAFLDRLRCLLGEGCGLLIGVDLQKDVDILQAAYNDQAGVTAAFNLNVLNHANRLLQAGFDLSQFEHKAFYNREQNRIEMHLVSTRAQRVRCRKGTLAFAAGETIHTENSYKYTVSGFAGLAAEAGFRFVDCWQDGQALFSVQYYEAI